MSLRAPLLAPALALALGCASAPPITELTFASTQRVFEPELLGGRVVGSHCFSQLFLQVWLTPPWRARRANHGLAMTDAMEQVPEADVLTDVVLRVDLRQYVLFQRTCAVVTGRPGRLP